MPIDRRLQDDFAYHCRDFDSKSLETIRAILDKHLESGEISLTKSGNCSTDDRETERRTPIEAVFVTMSIFSKASNKILTEEEIQEDKKYYEGSRRAAPADPKEKHKENIARDKAIYLKIRKKCTLLLERGKDNDEFIDDVLKKLATIENVQTLNDVVGMLIDELGVNRLEKNKDESQRKIPLFVAVAKSGFVTTKLINLLRSNEADINARDDDGFTPLHHIAGKIQPVQRFNSMLKAGADPDARQGGGSWYGKKPIDFVAPRYKEDVRGAIEEHKAEKKAAEAEKKAAGEGGKGDKKTITGTVKKKISKMFRKKSSAAAGSGADLDAHRTGREFSAEAVPNPNFAPGTGDKESSRLLVENENTPTQESQL